MRLRETDHRHSHDVPDMEWCRVALDDDPEADAPIDESFLVGGPEKRDIVLVPYDPDWPARFLDHRARIVDALGATCRRLEHVGSTAVPGLTAKPIIDILVTVADVDDESSYLPALERAGYVLRVREPGHGMVRTPELDVHVHVWDHDSPEAEALVEFRDRLRRSSESRDLYAATKQALAARDWPTMNHYADACQGTSASARRRP